MSSEKFSVCKTSVDLALMMSAELMPADPVQGN